MDATVRDASADALGTAMKVVGEKAMISFIQGIDALKMAKVKESCEKAEVKFVATSQSAPVQRKPPAVKRPVQNVPSSVSSSATGSMEDMNEGNQFEKAKSKGSRPLQSAKVVKKSIVSINGKKPATSNGIKSSGPSEDNLNDDNSTKPQIKSKTLVRGKRAATSSTLAKKEEEKSSVVLLQNNNLKNQRLADEKALKVLKWNFTAPREEFFVQLKEQMLAANWSPQLVTNCFHSDFKFHIKAIDSLADFLIANPEPTIANGDLILKWIALRFFDTNPSVILKCLTYLTSLFTVYQQANTILNESEANSFIPYLILKAGDPKDAVRNKVHDILAILRDIYAPSKIFTLLMTGLQSKNSRQRATCLDELAILIDTNGMTVCMPSPSAALKEIAKSIADKDNSVRNAALNCVIQTYFLEGEKVYKYVGNLSDKDLSLLEERIKRMSKTRVPPPSAPSSTLNTATISRQVHSSPALMNKTAENANTRLRSPSPSRGNTITRRKPESSKLRAKSMNLLAVDDENGEEQNNTFTRTPNLSRHETFVSRRTKTENSTSKLRPKSMGPLAFDDDLDNSQEENRVSPRSGNLSRVIEDLLNLPDVQYKKSSVQQPSTMSKLINSSPKAETAMKLVMAQLTSQEIPTALEAFAQLKELLNDKEKAENTLSSKVDQLIIMCDLQYRFFSNHLADENLSQETVIQLFQGVTVVLLDLFSNKALARKASRDVLRELMPHVISFLVDPRLTELSNGANLIKSVNVVATTIIHNANSTNMLCALIKMLHDCVGGTVSASTSSKYTELVMKCIWKLSRHFDNIVEDLDIDKVLLELHIFLKAFPGKYIYVCNSGLFCFYVAY